MKGIFEILSTQYFENFTFDEYDLNRTFINWVEKEFCGKCIPVCLFLTVKKMNVSVSKKGKIIAFAERKLIGTNNFVC